VLVPGVYGVAWGCSLDLDQSLIPTEDAAGGDVLGFGGTGGSLWTDANGGGGASDASDGASNADAANDASDASGDVAAPVSIDCDTVSCEAPEVCCYDSVAGGSCVTGPNPCSAISIACDSTADCADGELCCVIESLVTCSTDCAATAGALQFCKTNSECSSGVCGPLPSVVASLLPPGYMSCE
jgi:hypothetical protein